MADTPYIVLARKHRPKHFEDVIGQEHVGRTLSNALAQNRVAHALLFSGPRGVGKTSTARILARALNCQKGPTPHPCDECPACVEIAHGGSVDVIEIDAASNRGIDEIRELRDAVRYPPSRERYKVYIIDEVHMLTTPAFNALLKTLEEPPEHAVFIFATTEPHKIPDTILSRCQRYDFRRITAERIEEHLQAIVQQEGVEAEPAALRMIAEQSEGCMRDAQSQLDQLISFSDGKIAADLASRILGVVGRDSLFRLSRALLSRDVDTVLEVVDGAYTIGANLARFTSDILEHLRDLTVCCLAKNDGALSRLSAAERDEMRSMTAQTEPDVLHRMFSILLEAASEMAHTAYPKLLLEMALIRMTAIEPVMPIAEILARVESLANGPAGSTPLPSGGSGGSGVERSSVARASASHTPSAQASASQACVAPSRPATTTKAAPAESLPTPESNTAKPLNGKDQAHDLSQSKPGDAVAKPKNGQPAGEISRPVSAPKPPTPPTPVRSSERQTAESSDAGQGAISEEDPAGSRATENADSALSQPKAAPKTATKPETTPSTTVETKVTITLESEQEHRQGWTDLVAAVSAERGRDGGLLKHAELRSSRGVRFEVALAGAQIDVLVSGDRMTAIRDVAIRLFGDDADILVSERASDDVRGSDSFSIDGEEQKEIQMELARRSQAIEQHPATKMIGDIFQPVKTAIYPQSIEIAQRGEQEA
ncbi:MAG: DNA polymerase III subunit gamma/tau [Myxococcales bacterium]|nr:DNA polymerase III subunit gamma/tau [Myxococcales bacterium]